MKVQDRVFSKGWWMITTAMMTTALLVYTSVSLALVCGYVYKMQGIPIGGVLSSAALAIVLGF